MQWGALATGDTGTGRVLSVINGTRIQFGPLVWLDIPPIKHDAHRPSLLKTLESGKRPTSYFAFLMEANLLIAKLLHFVRDYECLLHGSRGRTVELGEEVGDRLEMFRLGIDLF